MSRFLTIDGKEYEIEFTIEASLCKDCVEKTVGLLGRISESQGSSMELKDVISTMSDIPQTSITMLYAGLLEHHGEDGDGSVLDISDAKKLAKQYFKENKESEDANFYGLMTSMVETMGEDGFFKQIGLEQMVQSEEKKTQKRKMKIQK